jgi:hypothetical protein
MVATTTPGASFSVLVLVSIVSLLVLAALAYFAFYINRARALNHLHFEELLQAWFFHSPRPDDSTVSNMIGEWYERRNEFWTSYGQFMLSGFVIAAITILLLTRTISAEAGLPVLAGVGGFAIGKGTSNRTANSAGTGGKAETRNAETPAR